MVERTVWGSPAKGRRKRVGVDRFRAKPGPDVLPSRQPELHRRLAEHRKERLLLESVGIRSFAQVSVLAYPMFTGAHGPAWMKLAGDPTARARPSVKAILGSWQDARSSGLVAG